MACHVKVEPIPPTHFHHTDDGVIWLDRSFQAVAFYVRDVVHIDVLSRPDVTVYPTFHNRVVVGINVRHIVRMQDYEELGGAVAGQAGGGKKRFLNLIDRKPAAKSAALKRPCAAPRPISTRFEPVTRLRSFTTGSSRIPSDLARRTRPVWQYQTVPALSALLPALPGVSRIRLHPAPTGLLRQPSEEVLHLPRFPAPHGALRPRVATTSIGRTSRGNNDLRCTSPVSRSM